MSLDLTGLGPSPICPGCNECEVWKVLVTFDHDTFEVATVSVDAYCSNCGTYADTPLPIHKDA